MKDAIVELGWIYRSDFCDEISERARAVGTLSKGTPAAYGEAYLNAYLTTLLLQYLGISHASQDWFLETAFPVLEDFLSRAEGREKQDRHTMRLMFTEVLADMARKIGMPVESLLAQLAYAMAEPAAFRELTSLPTMLDNLYCAVLVCEFASDIVPVARK